MREARRSSRGTSIIPISIIHVTPPVDQNSAEHPESRQDYVRIVAVFEGPYELR